MQLRNEVIFSLPHSFSIMGSNNSVEIAQRAFLVYLSQGFFQHFQEVYFVISFKGSFGFLDRL